jgi:hypothetical protein
MDILFVVLMQIYLFWNLLLNPVCEFHFWEQYLSIPWAFDC